MKRTINTPLEQMKFYQPLDKEGQPVVQYDDGTYKKLGQKRTYEGQPQSYIVRTKKNDVYLVEKEKKRKGRKKRKLLDGEDPRKPFTEKETEKRQVEFLKENKMRQDYHEEDLIEADWKRIYSFNQVPKSYYMRTKFNKDLNQDFIPSNVPHSPYHLFRLFFDDRIYNLIVKETNTYKHQFFVRENEKLAPDKKPLKEPLDYDTIDLDGYLAILVCMGVQQMRCPKANNEDPKIASDIIGKVREFMGYMNDNFKKYYYPGEFLSIDEGMIPFTGKVSFKVYNPDKPNKFGIKEFVCCDATNAYTLETQLYHGNHESEEFPEVTLSKTNEVVMNLLKDYEGKFHKVVMDNYYNSPMLFYLMKEKALGGLGTMRIGRLKLPQYLLAQIMEVHQNKTLAYVQGDINLAIFFRGTNDKEICLMSNFIDQKLVKHDYWKILANVKEDRDIFKEQSQMSAYYNKFKGGVDRRNSFLAMYRNKRRNYKWWRPVFYRMLDNAIVNAFILYNFNKSPAEKISQKDFRVQLYKELASRYSPPKSELAIKELTLMKDKSEEVNQIPQYFEKIMKHHILKNCNYSAHILVKSRSKKKLCVECKLQTLFSCSTCSNMFKMRISVCASGFNQCYDFHASKSYEEIIERLFIKRRSDGRILQAEKKKKKILIKLSDLHEKILNPANKNNEELPLRNMQIPQRCKTTEFCSPKKKFLEDDLILEENQNKEKSSDNSTAAKSNFQVTSSSNSSELFKGRRGLRIVRKQLQTKKTKSCDAIFTSDSRLNSSDKKGNATQGQLGLDGGSLSSSNSSLINLLKKSQKALQKKFIEIDKEDTIIEDDFENNNTDEDVRWINKTLSRINKSKLHQSQSESISQQKINYLDDAVETASNNSSLDENKLRLNYQQIPFTFGTAHQRRQEENEEEEKVQEQSEGELDEVAKEYQSTMRRLSQLNEDPIPSFQIQQSIDYNFFGERVGVEFYPPEAEEQKENRVEDPINNTATLPSTLSHNNITVKLENPHSPEKSKRQKDEVDCENLLNNAMDYTDYDFSSGEEEQFQYKKTKIKELFSESDTNLPISKPSFFKRNNKFKINDDYNDYEEEEEDEFSFERPKSKPRIIQNQKFNQAGGVVERKETKKFDNYVVIDEESEEDDLEGFVDIPNLEKKRIVEVKNEKKIVIVKKGDNQQPNKNVIYIKNQRYKIVKSKTTIHIDLD